MSQTHRRPFAAARLLARSSWLIRSLMIVALATLGSCRFLADEFSWIDRAGPVAEQEQLAPSPIDDRP